MTISGSIALLSGLLAGALTLTSPEPVWARSGGLSAAPGAHSSTGAATPTTNQPTKDFIIMADNTRSSTGAVEMAAAQALTTKVLAIGSWTAKATPETRPAIMPFEARDTLRLMLAGKIDQWFAKSDGSGAVFLMNVTDPAEAHKLLEVLPLGQAEMMTFELIPVSSVLDISVLDIGSGTGLFSGLLADWLGAVVLAVEPAKEMRAKALEGALRPNVLVIGGHAEELPLLDTSVDLAWLGFMIHHVVDRNSCARELTRVVRPNGVIFMAGAFPGHLDGITLFNFFPEARAVAENYPSLDMIVVEFEAAGLRFEAMDPVVQQTAPHLAAMAERTRFRGDTTLSLIPDEAFARGQKAIVRAAAEASAPVVDTLHIARFRRRVATP